MWCSAGEPANQKAKLRAVAEVEHRYTELYWASQDRKSEHAAYQLGKLGSEDARRSAQEGRKRT
jgi:hypothetical protein